MRAKYSTHLIFLDFVMIIKYGEVTDLEVSAVESDRCDSHRLNATVADGSVQVLEFRNNWEQKSQRLRLRRKLIYKNSFRNAGRYSVKLPDDI